MTTKRSRRSKIVWFLWSLEDHAPFKWNQDLYWTVVEKFPFDEWALKLVCFFTRHNIEDDQCGKPEHRFCLICHSHQPNMPVSKEPI